jgi:hypothetical protein
MTNNPYIPYNQASFGEINYPVEMTWEPTTSYLVNKLECEP